MNFLGFLVIVGSLLIVFKIQYLLHTSIQWFKKDLWEAAVCKVDQQVSISSNILSSRLCLLVSG